MDFVTSLTRSKGYDCIFLVVDMLKKMTHLFPVCKDSSAKDTDHVFMRGVFIYQGFLQRIISNRFSKFTSNFWRTIFEATSTKLSFSTAYHPQTNGQSERSNQEIEHYLRLFINYHQSDWDEWLPLAVFTYNDRVHSATKVTLFYADNG